MITSSSTDLSTLVHSCVPFDTMTSRSERQDHFGSDFVVIRAAMPFALLRLRSFEVGCGCSHDQNSPRISKKPMSSLGSNIASLGLTIFVGFHQRSVHSEPPPRKTTIFFDQKGRPQGRHKRNQPNAGFILFGHERGQIFYSSCCMAHVIYSGSFGVMKFIQQQAMQYFSVNSGLPSTLL